MNATESRINFLRTVAIGFCFAIHTAAYYLQLPINTGTAGRQVSNTAATDALSSNVSALAVVTIGPPLHQAVSLLALSWVMQSLLVHSLLSTGWSALWIAPRAVVLDTVWLTAAIALTHGPGSGLVAAYFVIIATAAWRLHLRCVQLATVLSVCGYLVVLGIGRFSDGILQSGTLIYVPRHHQGFVLVCLLLSGWIAIQTVKAAYSSDIMHPANSHSKTSSGT